jgi:hypothetical protein
MVLPRGIEPRSSVLQTGAMTTSAKAAFDLSWCSRVELNHLFNLTKIVLYHLTTRAWGVLPVSIWYYRFHRAMCRPLH